MAALRSVLAEFAVDLAPALRDLTKGESAVAGLTQSLRDMGSTAVAESGEVARVADSIGDLGEVFRDMGRAVVAALSFKTLYSWSTEVAAMGDELEKSAMTLGLTVESLQEYRHAAGLANISVEQLRMAFARLQAGAAQASEGGALADAFKKIGVETKNADGSLRGVSELMDDVADGLGALENATERNALAMQLFGKSGMMLLPLFAEGKEGIRGWREELEIYGGGISTEVAKKTAAINDELQRMGLSMLSLKALIAQALLPPVTALVGKAALWLGAFVKWAKSTKLVEVALIGLATKGIPSVLRSLRTAAVWLGRVTGLTALAAKSWKALGLAVSRTVLQFAALDDALVFLAGGDSLIGRGLDAAFGEGSQAKVRDFLKVMFSSFENFGDGLGIAVAAVVQGITGVLATVGGKLITALDGIGVVLYDIFARAFNGLIGLAESTANKIADILQSIGLDGAAERLRDAARRGAADSRMEGGDFDSWEARKKAREGAVSAGWDNVAKELRALVNGPGGFMSRADARARRDAALAEAEAFKNFRAAPDSITWEAPFRFDQANGGQPLASLPGGPQQVINQQVGAPQIRVNQNFTVPAGTPVEQQREIAKSSRAGVTGALNTPAMQAWLLPTP